ncbi:MAG: hypothetical protein ACPL68_04650, partial [Candidatus Hydrothermia bacterium]
NPRKIVGMIRNFPREYRYLQIVENIWGKKRKKANQRAVFSIPGAEGLELRCLYRALEILYENKEMIERALRTLKSSLEISNNLLA